MLSVTYASAASSFFTEQRLTDLLTTSRAKNTSLGITGVLLYQRGNFMQTLEGPEEAVSALFADITFDVRHGGVSTVLWEYVHDRQFEGWSMGFRSLDNQEADSLLAVPASGQHAAQQFSRAEAFHRVFRESIG